MAWRGERTELQYGEWYLAKAVKEGVIVGRIAEGRAEEAA